MNYRIFRAINQLVGRYPLLDNMMITISQKVRYLYAFLFILMWFRNNVYKKITLYAGISAGITLFINGFIRRFYFKPRPFLKHNVRVLPPSPSKMNSSFPSKHTAIAFAVATSVLFYKRLLGCIMWLLAFWAGFSRIWMGQHYPSDIIGSALLGSLSGVVVNNTLRVWNPFIVWTIHTYNRICSLIKFR
ncbi:undecaprenyl-diphosphatase [Ectobacillus panaciterrae]|uniref:undecaprenyl-diphosphatase n=1 Tax=Ectobacillus panaciterrae TaxID=363872 RepID=UPI0004076886|nr:undecaprenyl-diphosphatase [Ectobacillus panaciterrae]